jgi:small subunit ribosomal protein S9
MPTAKKKTTTKKAKAPVKVAAPKEEKKETVVVETEPETLVEVFGTEEAGKNDPEKYFEAVGRRKEAIARVRLYTRKATDMIPDDTALIIVNDKDYKEYFPTQLLQIIVETPLRKLKSLNRFKATVLVRGGGLAGQAEAVRHGLSRTLIQFDMNFRKKLKKAMFLKRDPRIKERRKYGLKKARKAGQWSKR